MIAVSVLPLFSETYLVNESEYAVSACRNSFTFTSSNLATKSDTGMVKAPPVKAPGVVMAEPSEGTLYAMVFKRTWSWKMVSPPRTMFTSCPAHFLKILTFDLRVTTIFCDSHGKTVRSALSVKATGVTVVTSKLGTVMWRGFDLKTGKKYEKVSMKV